VRRPFAPGLRFAWATGIALLGVLLLGWLTGLRGVMHALLITMGAAAPVPFALVLALVALVAAASLAGTLLAEDSGSAGAAAGATHGGGWQRAFHSQVARQRQRPLAWGFAVGGLLGVVGVWLVLAALVVPLEARTLGILRLARARLSSATLASATLASALPPADAVLRPSAWSSASGGADEPVLDAFGHPLTREGGGAAGEFTLRSLGLDGVASGDDLCAGGRAGDGAAAVGESLRFVEDLRADRLGWSALFAAIEGARCSTR
jgi:hypothetical protein